MRSEADTFDWRAWVNAFGPCVIDSTEIQGLGPLRRKFPKRWHKVLRRGRPGIRLRNELTVAEFFQCGGHPSTTPKHSRSDIRQPRRCAHHVVSVMGGHYMLEIDDRALLSLESALLDCGYSNAIVRRSVSMLRQGALKVQAALGIEPLVTRNPAGPIKPVGPCRPRPMREPAAVVQAMRACEDPALIAVMALVMGCGLREVEVLRLRAGDFQVEPGWVWVHTPGQKAKDGHEVGRWAPLPRWVQGSMLAAFENLMGWPPGALLFPSRKDANRPRTSYGATLRRLFNAHPDLQPVTFTEMRRIWQGLARKMNLARALVRGTLAHPMNRSGRWWELDAGYKNAHRLATAWPSAARLPAGAGESRLAVGRRAPKGTKPWQPEVGRKPTLTDRRRRRRRKAPPRASRYPPQAAIQKSITAAERRRKKAIEKKKQERSPVAGQPVQQTGLVAAQQRERSGLRDGPPRPPHTDGAMGRDLVQKWLV